MSHFACLVITSTKPDKEELARILQPWHEFECTGIKDQYVVEVDVTDKVIEEFNKPQEVVVTPWAKTLKVAPHFGFSVYSRWDDRFYTKEPTEKPIFGSRKEFELPAGAELKTMTAEEARTHGIGYATLAQCAKEYFGEIVERDGKFYDLTNTDKWVWIDATGKEVGRTTGDEALPGMQPNAGVSKGQSSNTEGSDSISYPVKKVLISGTKWDWWQVGGRWTGMLIPHYDPSEDERNKETCTLCKGTGKRADMTDQEKCNGCNGTGISKKWPTSWARIEGDQMRLGDIPLITLRDEKEQKALQRYDKAQDAIKGRPVPNWNEIVKKHSKDYAKAREEYHNDPVYKDLMKAKVIDIFEAGDLIEFTLPREQVARIARASAICPFAYVHNGEWYERGEMGWWACVSNEKDEGTWAEQFGNMLDSLSPDTWVSVIDCHI